MFPAREFCSMVYIALQLVILCYLIKIYGDVLQLGTNNQQDLTEGRERSNRERINDIADQHIRYATEHDEREGWVSVFSFCNFLDWKVCSVPSDSRAKSCK